MSSPHHRLAGRLAAVDPATALQGAVLAPAVAALVAAAMLTQAAGEVPLEGHHLAIGAVAVGLVGTGVSWLESAPGWGRAIAAPTAGAVLVAAVYRTRDGAFPLGGPSTAETALVVAALVALSLSVADVRRLTPWQWLLSGAFVAVVVGFLGHLHTVPAGTAAPAWPLWAAVVATVCLLVIPRVVPAWAMFGAIAAVAAAASAVALASVVLGEFAVAGLAVTTSDQTVPLVGYEHDAWRAHAGPFDNVNVMGLVAFAGVLSAGVVASAATTARERALTAAAGLVSVGALVATSSGAAWIAAAVALFVLATAAVDRRLLAPAVGVATVGALAVIVAAYVAEVPVDDSGRYIRWRAGLAAFAADPSLLGEGHIDTAAHIAPHLEGAGASTPHNSYLSVLLRLGAVGALSYGVLVAGTIAYRTATARPGDAAVLAFAVGWAVHHLFESYTLLQWTAPAVLAALTLGYLLAGARHPATAPPSGGP